MQLSIPLRIPLQIPPETLERLAAARLAAQLSTPELARSVRALLERTVLRQYRKLVLQRLPQLLNPELEGSAQVRNVGFTVVEQQQYLRALEQAAAGGTEGREAQRQLRTLQRELTRRLDRRGPRSLSTGQYQARLQEVLSVLTDPRLIEVWTEAAPSGGGVRLYYGIGARRLLDRILVPSFMLTKSGKSQTGGVYLRAVMWRQLEFGAGKYFEDPLNITGRKKPRRPGGWRFGSLGVVGIRGAQGLPLMRAELERLKPQLVALLGG